MKEVLNYRPGGNPSSIDTVASSHVRFNLEKDHFEAFEASFIETLRHKIQSQEDSAHLEEITEAWKMLFEPVRAEMLGYAAHQAEVQGAVSKTTTHAPAAAKRAAQAGES
jgi:hemoglobin-like flavoprotein